MPHFLDKLLCAIALVLLAPIFAIVAVAILIDTPGPVFFRQERVGQNGQIFRIHKFRTMVARKPKVNVSASGDPRVTRVGRILRKTKIDELAQLIDVLQGHMALVGPRPEVPEYVAQWPEDLRPLILSVRPGITDPASIRYRNEADELAQADDPERYYVEVLLPKKTALYADYVKNRSFLGDLSLIFKTLEVVVKH